MKNSVEGMRNKIQKMSPKVGARNKKRNYKRKSKKIRGLIQNCQYMNNKIF